MLTTYKNDRVMALGFPPSFSVIPVYLFLARLNKYSVQGNFQLAFLFWLFLLLISFYDYCQNYFDHTEKGLCPNILLYSNKLNINY